MTKNELLKKYYDLEMNVVHRTSGDYTLTFPLKGMEDAWREARVRASELQAMMDEDSGITTTSAVCSVEEIISYEMERRKKDAGESGYED